MFVHACSVARSCLTLCYEALICWASGSYLFEFSQLCEVSFIIRLALLMKKKGLERSATRRHETASTFLNKKQEMPTLLFTVISFGASLIAQLVKNLSAVQETQVQFLGSGRFPGEGNGNPLQYSC